MKKYVLKMILETQNHFVGRTHFIQALGQEKKKHENK